MSTRRFDQNLDFGRGGDQKPKGRPPSRSKSELTWFISLNVLVMPLAGLIYATVNAEGLAVFQPIFGMPLYRGPGFGWMEQYAGWNRVNFGHVSAIGLLILLNGVWCWVVKHLRGVGNASVERNFEGSFFKFKAVLAGAAIAIETVIFFAGLATVSGGPWGGGSWTTTALITVLYLIGMIWIAIWHTNFRYGGPKL